MLLRITAAPGRGYRLKADKGINLPESDFTIPALPAKDLQDLTFAAPHADLINDAFVHRVADIEALHQHCAERGISEVALVLKVETLQAVRDLRPICPAFGPLRCWSRWSGGGPTRAAITDAAMGARAEHGRHRNQWRSCLAFSLEPSPKKFHASP